VAAPRSAARQVSPAAPSKDPGRIRLMLAAHPTLGSFEPSQQGFISAQYCAAKSSAVIPPAVAVEDVPVDVPPQPATAPPPNTIAKTKFFKIMPPRMQRLCPVRDAP